MLSTPRKRRLSPNLIQLGLELEAEATERVALERRAETVKQECMKNPKLLAIVETVVQNNGRTGSYVGRGEKIADGVRSERRTC